MALRRWCFAWLLGLGGAVGVARAQEAVQPDATVGAALRGLASRASEVFVGQVASITRKRGVVEIVFRVDLTVQGSAQSTYTLREWAGLWPPGQHRYWVGERAMVFMRRANGAGLSTPVDGPDGVVPVLVQGAVAEPLIDVRRLSARVERKTTDPLTDDATAAVTLSEAAAVAASWRKPVWREPVRRPLPPIFRAPKPILRGRVPVRLEPGNTQLVLDATAGGNDAR